MLGSTPPPNCLIPRSSSPASHGSLGADFPDDIDGADLGSMRRGTHSHEGFPAGPNAWIALLKNNDRLVTAFPPPWRGTNGLCARFGRNSGYGAGAQPARGRKSGTVEQDPMATRSQDLPCDHRAAEHCGEVRVLLARSRSNRRAVRSSQIAAIAARWPEVVTQRVGKFSQEPGLAMANWVDRHEYLCAENLPIPGAARSIETYFQTCHELPRPIAFTATTERLWGRGCRTTRCRVFRPTCRTSACACPPAAAEPGWRPRASTSSTPHLLRGEHSVILWLVPSKPIREQTLARPAQPPASLSRRLARSRSITVLDLDDAKSVTRATLDTSTTIIVATRKPSRSRTRNAARSTSPAAR